MLRHPLDRRDLLTLAGLATLAPGAAHSPSIMGSAMQSIGDRRRELYSLLGDLPDRQRPVGGRKRSEQPRAGIDFHRHPPRRAAACED